ncbi:MAG: sulfotransferase [Proteobacteria bacterium]|nr:sulfotransferase [Pseudomonadota bacterium]
MMTETAFKESLRQVQAALRSGQAATAERWLRALEREFPGDTNCLWLLGVALLDQGRAAESRSVLETVLIRAPDFGEARIDLARACRTDRQAARARDEVRQVLSVTPQHHRAWLAYGDVLVDLDQHSDAGVAFNRASLTDPHRRAIEQATAALEAGDRRAPEGIFRDILQQDASHVAALCGLAALSLAADVPADALRLLKHALKQCQHFPLIWRGMAPTLMAAGRLDEADAAARYLLKIEPDSPQSWIARAAISSRLLRQEEALHAYGEALRLMPQEVRIQMSMGHLHKTLGRRQESEASYKEALRMQPGSGEAYWSLADLKNYSFSDAEIAEMQRSLAEDQHERNSRAQLLFALGKAFEQRKQFATAFEYYADGNSARRHEAPFDIEHFERRTARIRATFDAAFFARHARGGYSDGAPIFIVGLPRSGSTLIEQILASHSRVEGTMELPNIINITRELTDGTSDRDGYPDTVRALSTQRLTDLGRRYMEETAPLRTGRPRFTDKMPNNFSHVGLIAALLPNATLIDARRHPMDSCFSTFKQYFAEGQTFSYSLEDLGRYYRCYLSLMDHWDRVLPGKVLHVQYEEMVRAPEQTIRRLLDHCGLPFEADCLTFNQTQRAVRTASAEQVRQPIYGSAVGYWRNFEAQLEPLKRSLGDSLARFAPLDSA